jgi:probable addiction module antidote protein
MAKSNRLELTLFDASDYLDDEVVIAEYLAAALEDPDPGAFLDAVADVAKAKGMTAVAERAGLGRESLYKALRRGAKPRFETVRRLLNALDVEIEIVPKTRAG